MLVKVLSRGVILMVTLTIAACSTDSFVPATEQQGDPEGAECISKGYEFASAMYATCRNELVEEHAKQKKSDTKGIY